MPEQPQAQNDQLSADDLQAVAAAQQHLAALGDPRADKIKQFLATQTSLPGAGSNLDVAPTNPVALRNAVPTQFERERGVGSTSQQSGILSSFGREIGNIASGIASLPAALSNPTWMIQQGAQIAADDTQRRADNRSLPYRLTAGAASLIGVNARQMEDAADAANARGVIGTALGDAVPAIAPLAVEGAIRARLPEAAVKTGQVVKSGAATVVDAARNNPVTNTVLGSNPDALPAPAALIKATRPRNSIRNVNKVAETALPDMRRAADNLGLDLDNLTLQDAEKAVTQAKKDVWSEFEQNHLTPNADTTVNAQPVADKINAVGANMSAIARRRMPGVVDEIADHAADYDGQRISVGDVEDRIQELNNQLRAQQATYKVNEMNLRNDPKFAHEFAELDGLRELESQAFEQLDGEGGGAAVKDLKTRYGALKVMQDVIDRRIPVVERQAAVKVSDWPRMAGAAKMAQGTWATLLGSPREGLPDLAEGYILSTRGANAAKLNDSNFLIQQAFKKTTPRAPMSPGPLSGEYMPEPSLPVTGPQQSALPSGATKALRGMTPMGGTVEDPNAGATVNFYANPGTRAQRLGLLLPESAAGKIPLPASTLGTPTMEGIPHTEAAPSAAESIPANPAQAASGLARDKATGKMVRLRSRATINAPATDQSGNPEGNAGAGQAVSQPTGASSPTATGAATEVRVPGQDRSYAGRYEVRELDDVHASHNGISFQPNPSYALKNDREYSNSANQGKVIAASAPGKFDPAYHITDNPDATNGPMVIDSDGNVLGGNGRKMILDRVYRFNPSGADAYKAALAKKASQFGIDPQVVNGMKRPVLVRALDDSEFPTAEVKQDAITDFNKKGTAELTPAERSISDSRRMSQETLDDISGRLDQAGENASLADALRGPHAEGIVDNLIKDGVLSPQERAAYVTDAGLTDAAKQRIGKLLVGRFFRDPAQIDSFPPAMRAKLEKIAAPLAKLSGSGEWDIEPAVREATDLLSARQAHGGNIDDFVRQQGLFGDQRWSPEAVAVAKQLESFPANQIVKHVRRYVRDAGDSGRTLLGPGVTREQAFREAFGTESPATAASGAKNRTK